MATALNKIHGRLTKEDIKKGKSADGESCPIALCLKRQFPRRKIAVGLLVAFLGNTEYQLSQNAKCFVLDFDANRRVKPIKFTLTKK